MVNMCIAVAAVPGYIICIFLQIDQCRYIIIVLTIFICYKRNARQAEHIVDVIYMHLHVCSLTVI